MEQPKIRLTEAEWSVMECLWTHSPLTGREAVAQLKERCGWSRSTTLTLLRRLEEKGAVSADPADPVKRFRPLIRRADAAAQETEDFLGRVYHGSVSMMVSALTKKEALPQSEIDELYALLQELEGDK